MKSIVLALFLSFSLSTSSLTAQIDTSLIGDWYGVVFQTGFPSYTAQMTIDNLVVGQPSGQIVYPTLPCTGSNIFIGFTDSIHIFSETIINGSICGDSGRVEIYKSGPDSIQWNWYYQGGNISQALGRLGRQITGMEDGGEAHPNGIQISGIYPNPFTDQASIDIEVDQLENISINLYNYLGSKMQTIYSGKVIPSQKHRFRIEGNSIPNGCYIVQVIGSDFQMSKRVFLME